MLKKNYKGYTALDFLKNDDFLRWNLFRTDEDTTYWAKVMKECPEVESSLKEAIELYNSQIVLNDFRLTSSQIEDCYKDFSHKVSRRKIKRTLFRWIPAAASVLLLILGGTYLYVTFGNTEQPSGILDFAQQNILSDRQSSADIQLYFSSDKLIELKEKEAEIAYQPDSIQIVGQPVAEANAAEFSQLLVPKGKRSRLTLCDGTTLYVNADTKVVYPNQFNGKLREVYVDGEVYIDVTPNPGQPFIVRTDKIDIRVLGTRFNVNTYQEEYEIQVVLASGSVQIIPHDNARKVELTPAQMYTYSEGQATIKRVDTEKHTSWIYGFLYVDDERLDVVLSRLSRYYGEEILSDADIADQICEGKIDLKSNLGDVLRGLSFSFPIVIEQENGVYNVRKK